jgi:spore germination cell wall hydrolase CwlJ-like protein
MERARPLLRRWAEAAARLADTLIERPHAILTLGALVAGGLVMAASTPSAFGPENATVNAIVAEVGPDLSDAALLRVSSRLDPAGLALARRHDPALTPAVWGLTPGWDNLSLSGRPPLDALGRAGVEIQRLNAASPVVTGALRPISAFAFRPTSEADRRRAQRCLTQAIYYEAALEPHAGQQAVAQVVLNRVRDPNFPASVCGVVFQGAERTTGCQFSFTCDGSLARTPVAWAWNRAEAVAREALAGHVADSVGTATHYHADYVRPWWAPSLTKVNQIGAHIFYRWRGGSGETTAFRQAYSGREPVIDEARFARPRLIQIINDAAALEAAGVVAEGRTVVIDGQVRQVGILSLGGRRQPTRDDIAAINARMAEYEAGNPEGGVPLLDVEEVNRPSPEPPGTAGE